MSPKPPNYSAPTTKETKGTYSGSIGDNAGLAPHLSIVIVSWNTRAILKKCLDSIFEHLANVSFEVIVVDNASTDDSAGMVASLFPSIHLIRNEQNAGFGQANNQGMHAAGGDWYLLLNSDTFLVDGSIAQLVNRVSLASDIGIAQCQLRMEDGRLQHSAYRFPSVPLALIEGLGFYKALSKRQAGRLLLSGYWDYAEERDVDWVTGAFMLLPAQVFRETGGFDERLFMYGEDMEWCYRIQDRGWRIRYFPQARIIHMRHASADLKYGEARIALCLRRRQEIFGARYGSSRAAALLASEIVGAVLRVAYYSARVWAGGPRAGAYIGWQRHSRIILRGLVTLVPRPFRRRQRAEPMR